MTGAERRRAGRAASDIWQDQRRLPMDFPTRSADPVFSTSALCNRVIGVVERSGVLEPLEAKLRPRRGRKPMVSIKALLVCILLAGYLDTNSYQRTDVVRALYGLPPAIADALGLLDASGEMLPISYKHTARRLLRLEALLWLGWNRRELRCDSAWLMNCLVTASVPRRVRRSVEAAAVDSTPVKAWATPTNYAKQSDINKDAFALHRRAVLENPDLPEPDPDYGAALTAAASRHGVLVGDDGRVVRCKDHHARAGYATATNKRKAHFYIGYELTAVVAVRSLRWKGRPDKATRGPQMPPCILAAQINPAGQNPGPVGLRAAKTVLAAGSAITEVIADRAYTVKHRDFNRGLHRLGINVVMDHPSRAVARPKIHSLGRRPQRVIEHCGTFLPDWTPQHLHTPPKQLSGTKLEDWYNTRYRSYGYRSTGPQPGNRRRFQCPVHAGHNTTPGTIPNSYSAPLAALGDATACCDGKVTAQPEDLDTYQTHPYGTTAWRISYSRRPAVEGPFGKLKDGDGLGGSSCQAFGIAAHTLAATAAIVAYNLKLGLNNTRGNDKSDTEVDDNGEPRSSTNQASSSSIDYDFTGQTCQRLRAPP